jgi:hypothetical protein
VSDSSLVVEARNDKTNILPHYRQYEDLRRQLQRREDIPWQGSYATGHPRMAASVTDTIERAFTNSSATFRVNSMFAETTKFSDFKTERPRVYSFSARILAEFHGPSYIEDNTRRVSLRLVNHATYTDCNCRFHGNYGTQ